MALFVTRHQHTDETCPAGHSEMGPMLLQHLSDENAANAGIKSIVTFCCEWVTDQSQLAAYMLSREIKLSESAKQELREMHGA